jgi:hypothetical protein
MQPFPHQEDRSPNGLVQRLDRAFADINAFLLAQPPASSRRPAPAEASASMQRRQPRSEPCPEEIGRSNRAQSRFPSMSEGGRGRRREK